MDSQRRKTRVAWLSVTSNAVLVAAKLVIGLLIGSVAVVSEAIHSGIDLVAAVIALVAVRTANKAPDQAHPFGHGKIENLSGAIEALLIFLAAGWIVYEAVEKLLHPQLLEAPGWGVGVMAASAAANLYVSRQLFKVGRETDSIALMADGWHLRTDVYTSAGVMAGLGLVMLGGWLMPTTNLGWLDPVAAIAVALLIVKAAWDLTLQAVRDLLDESLPPEDLRTIQDAVAQTGPGICSLHRLRTRKSGPMRFVDFHLAVEPNLTVAASHELADKVTAAINARLPGTNVTVHVEPCNAGRCPPRCMEGCLRPASERGAAETKPAA